MKRDGENSYKTTEVTALALQNSSCALTVRRKLVLETDKLYIRVEHDEKWVKVFILRN